MKAITLSSVLVLLSNFFMANIIFGEEDLYIGTFYGVNVSSKGWSSEGIMPAVRMALNHVNKDHSILPGYTLREDRRDSQVRSGKIIGSILYITQIIRTVWFESRDDNLNAALPRLIFIFSIHLKGKHQAIWVQ